MTALGEKQSPGSRVGAQGREHGMAKAVHCSGDFEMAMTLKGGANAPEVPYCMQRPGTLMKRSAEDSAAYGAAVVAGSEDPTAAAIQVCSDRNLRCFARLSHSEPRRYPAAHSFQTATLIPYR